MPSPVVRIAKFISHFIQNRYFHDARDARHRKAIPSNPQPPLPTPRFEYMALLLPFTSLSSSNAISLPSPLSFSNPKTKQHLNTSNSASVRASWQELAGVLIFSAIPFTAVKAIANSAIGASLQKRLQETKKTAVQNSSRFKDMAKKARKKSFWYGEERPRWLGPIQFEYPTYLTGEFPGDYGFDIAGLSKDPVTFGKYFNFEILHARWAMLAALGVVVPELLDQLGVVHFVEPVWWRVGYAKLQGDTLDYLGIPGLHIAGSQGVFVIAICQALLMVGPEYARYCGIEALEPLGIYLPGDINYPGGVLFDPLGLSKDPEAFEELKVKEIKNGRLAMVAWLGFYFQAALTGTRHLRQLPSDTLATCTLQSTTHQSGAKCVGTPQIEPGYMT